jgi:HlyD family secretion protein
MKHLTSKYVTSTSLTAFVGLLFGMTAYALYPATTNAVRSEAAVPNTQTGADQTAIAPLISGDYLVAAPGRVEPKSEEIGLSVSVTGTITEILVHEGDQIKRGDIVARLESEDYTANVAKAQASLQLANAQLEKVVNGALPAERQAALARVQAAEAIARNAGRELNRANVLRPQGAISLQAADKAQQDFSVAEQQHREAAERYALVNDATRDEDVRIARARVAVAEADFAAAKADLDKTILRSPLDGTVLKISKRPGEVVSNFVNEPILTIGDTSTLMVRAEIDEADIAKVASGLPAYVTAEAYGGEKFSGHVVRIAQTLGRKEVQTGSPRERSDRKVLEALIALDGPNALRPGLRVNTFITQTSAAPTAQAEK